MKVNKHCMYHHIKIHACMHRIIVTRVCPPVPSPPPLEQPGTSKEENMTGNESDNEDEATG